MIDKLKSFNNSVLFVVRHLFKRVMQSPLLIGWIIIGTIIDIIIGVIKALKLLLLT